MNYAGADYPNSNVLGTGPVNLNGGTLYLWRVYPLNSLIANGGSIFSGNGFGNNWDGPITLNVDTTVNCQFILRANGAIGGAGGSIKTGNDRLWLNGSNTYTGDTTVNAGTLRVTGDSIVDTGKLVIDGGVVEPVGSETVGSLFFGAVEQAAGTYGSTSSGATNQDDSRFSGSGIVVVPGASSAYDDWALAAGLDGTPGKESGKADDPDGDGKDNNHEFAFNGDPLDSSDNGQVAGLVQDASSPAGEEFTLVVAVRDGASFASSGMSPGLVQTTTVDGVVYTVEGSEDLSGFPNSDVSFASGPSDTAPAATGLPDLTGTDWEYHTFKLDSSEGLGGKGFLCAKAEVAP